MSASTKTVPCHRTVAVKNWLAVVFSSLCVFSFVSSIQRAWQEFRRPLADLFRVVCPQFVEHRWQYLYECVQWVLSRKAALQYLKLNDIAQSGERDSGESDKHQLSSRHLELLANLSASNEQSLRFWTTAGLTMILATWGHRVSGYLHSCPCHPLPSNKDANRERAKQRDRLWFQDVMTKPEDACCPMAGRMAVALASGYVQHALDNLKRAGVPASLQNSLDDLNSFGNDGGTRLMSNFQAAKSRLTFRMTQSFGYWTRLPWALLMIMRPYVETFSSPEEARPWLHCQIARGYGYVKAFL